MEKCEICGKETDDLYECSYCGQLVCANCGGTTFQCDECFDRQWEHAEFDL